MKKVSVGLVIFIFGLILIGSRYLLLSQWITSGPTQCKSLPALRTATWTPCGNFKNQKVEWLMSLNSSLNGISLVYASLENTYFLGGHWNQAWILNSIFQEFHSFGGDFTGAHIRGSKFFASETFRATFKKSRFIGTTVEASRLFSTDFTASFFRGSRFINCDLENSDFRGADLGDTVFLLTNLKGAKFDSKTHLPFPRQVAQDFGMIYVD